MSSELQLKGLLKVLECIMVAVGAGVTTHECGRSEDAMSHSHLPHKQTDRLGT